MSGDGSEHEPDQVGAALERAGAKLQCPSCKGVKWSKDANPVILPVSERRGEMSTRAGFPVHALICVKCGYVRLHAVRILSPDAA
jgi:hypothetical protein